MSGALPAPAPHPQRLLRRGSIAVAAASLIQALIAWGWAQPWPDAPTAMLASAAVAAWGAIDLLRHAVGHGRRRDA